MEPEKTTVYSYKTPIVLGFIGGFVLLGINQAAEFFKIYSGYHWFDIPMHLTGGFVIGLITIGIVRAVLGSEKYEKTPQLLITLLGAFVVGIAWEVIEAYYGVSVLYGGNFWFDTIKDLLLDTLGGILSYICFHPQKQKNLKY